jgi:ubiquinone/menaquinone biosynthesis C-methylase UbiE
VRDPSTEDPSCRGGSIKLPQVHKKFSDEIRGGKVTIIVGWSNVLKMFPDNSLDWIYIDGDHRYETVKQDIKQGCRVVKPDGMVMGHDSHPKMQRSYIQVRKALDDMGKEYEEIGNNYIIKGEL